MSFRLRYFIRPILATFYRRRHLASRRLVSLVVLLGCLLLLGTPEALAGLNDDKYEGNVFALYAGNGGLIAPRMSLAEALKQDKPTLLVLYV
ncbi:MAG TPA: thioredoxin family protein, partial [Allocoleopsis sp.]